MKKQVIISIISVLLIIIFIVFSWYYIDLKKYEEDTGKTQQLAKNIIELMDNGSLNSTFISNHNINWGENFLVLVEYGTRYNSEWNQKLETEKNFPGNHIKGLVIIDIEEKVIGEYVSLGDEKVGDAIQKNYIISYFDLAKNCIIAIDLVAGNLPSKSKSTTGTGSGELAQDELVIKQINKRLGR